MGVALGPDDWAVRCNLMTILDGRMADFTAGHITNDEAGELIAALQATLGRPPGIEFHPGRELPQPPDLSRRARRSPVRRRRPRRPRRTTCPTSPPPTTCRQGRGGAAPRPDEPGFGGRSDRITRSTRPGSPPGSGPPTPVWLWGQGKAPAMTPFAELHGLTRGDRVGRGPGPRGRGCSPGWDRVDAPGATGYLDTDYASKGRAGDRGPGGPRHRLRPRRGPRRGQPRRAGRGQGRGPGADRPRHRRPAAAALEAHGDYRILDLARTIRRCCGPGRTTVPRCPGRSRARD